MNINSSGRLWRRVIVTSFESLPKELFQLSMSLQVVGQGNEFEFASVLNSLLDCLILVQFLLDKFSLWGF